MYISDFTSGQKSGEPLTSGTLTFDIEKLKSSIPIFTNLLLFFSESNQQVTHKFHNDRSKTQGVVATGSYPCWGIRLKFNKIENSIIIISKFVPLSPLKIVSYIRGRNVVKVTILYVNRSKVKYKFTEKVKNTFSAITPAHIVVETSGWYHNVPYQNAHSGQESREPLTSGTLTVDLEKLTSSIYFRFHA